MMPELNFYATDAADPEGAAGQVLQPQYSTVVPGYNYGDGNTPGGNGFMEFGSGTPGSLPFRVDQSGDETVNNLTVNGSINSPGLQVTLRPSGDTTGATDTAAINAAEAALPPGSVLTCGAGQWYINAPLSIAPTTTFQGVHGAVAAADVNASPAQGTVFNVVAGFTAPTITIVGASWFANSTDAISASAAIAVMDVNSGGWPSQNSGNSVGVYLKDFMVELASAPASVDAIASFGGVQALRIQDVGANNATGNGMVGYGYGLSGGDYQPDGWHGQRVIMQNCTLDSFGKFIWNDCTFIDFHAQGQFENQSPKTNAGFNINQGSVRLFGCRSEFRQTSFLITATIGNSNPAPIILSGCTVDSADHNGIWLNNTTTSAGNPVIIDGCQVDSVGQNAGAGGGGYAGIRVTGNGWKVSISNTHIWTGGSPAGAEYGLVAEQFSSGNHPQFIEYVGGAICAVTTPVTSDNTTVSFYVDPSTQQLTGVAGSYTYYPSSLDVPGTNNGALTGTIAPTLGIWTPRNHAAIAWAFDPCQTNMNPAALTSGLVYLIGLYAPRWTTTTGGHFYVTTAATSVTAGENFIGLYNSAGTLVASAGMDSNITSTGQKAINWSASASISPGYYWLALVFNATGTQMAVGCGNTAGITNLVNFSLTGTVAACRYVTNVGSATTVAAGSNGGEISAVASWTSPSAGVLDVASTAGWAPSGTFTVATSSTTATCTYTGIATGQLTGVAYVSGSATGTVATGGAVTPTVATALPSPLVPASNTLYGDAIWGAIN